MRKYGLENFEFSIIENNIITREILNEKEIYYIELYKSRDPKFGYNIHYGGNDQIGEHNAAYGFTGSKSWHAKKVIDLTTGIIYESMIDCAIELFGDAKYLKCISNICNPNINKFSFRNHEFRKLDENNNIIEKNIKKKNKSEILIKEENTNIITRSIEKTYKRFLLTKKTFVNALYKKNKNGSIINQYYNFTILYNSNIDETKELTKEQLELIQKNHDKIYSKNIKF